MARLVTEENMMISKTFWFFEDKKLKPAKVRKENLRIVVDLPDVDG